MLNVVLLLLFFIFLNELARQVLKRVYKRCVEFPHLSLRLLDKFNTWDGELGWCPNKNSRKYEKTKYMDEGESNLITFDELGSRLAYNGDPSIKSVSCYGDSFCLAREVPDRETWAYVLGQITGACVSNYGVGGYGLDQALMRCERGYDADPTDIVIMSVTSVSVARISSVYRHYIDPGNVLGVKPRFVLSDDGVLGLIPYPFGDKSCFRNLGKYKQHFRDFDEHHHCWRKASKKKRYMPSLVLHGEAKCFLRNYW
jgi:hypothetical protein